MKEQNPEGEVGLRFGRTGVGESDGAEATMLSVGGVDDGGQGQNQQGESDSADHERVLLSDDCLPSDCGQKAIL
jgi:hypothetical protein